MPGALIREPELLILDEPTNHLDLETTGWLEDYLSRSRMSLLMVTHDRYFLDRVCTDIVELDDRTTYSYKGNYSLYLEKRQQRLDAADADASATRTSIARSSTGCDGNRRHEARKPFADRVVPRARRAAAQAPGERKRPPRHESNLYR